MSSKVRKVKEVFVSLVIHKDSMHLADKGGKSWFSFHRNDRYDRCEMQPAIDSTDNTRIARFGDRSYHDRCRRQTSFSTIVAIGRTRS